MNITIRILIAAFAIVSSGCESTNISSFPGGRGGDGIGQKVKPKDTSRLRQRGAVAGIRRDDRMNLGTGDYIMDMGGGDMMNLGTGDYIMDMGGGDMMNLETGDYIMDMGGGDMMNLETGDYIMDMGE